MNDIPQPLPREGLYRIHDWAEILGCCDESIKTAIKQYKIPVIQILSMKFIDAAVWWEHNKPAQLKSNHGGYRLSKK